MIGPDVVGASRSIAAPLFWPLVLMIYLPIIISFIFDLAYLALATCFWRLMDRIFTNYWEAIILLKAEKSLVKLNNCNTHMFRNMRFLKKYINLWTGCMVSHDKSHENAIEASSDTHKRLVHLYPLIFP